MKYFLFKRLTLQMPLFWLWVCFTGVTTRVMSQTSPGGVSANLKAWYRASTGVTGTTSVTAWHDQTTNGLNVTQATSSHQPSLSSASRAFNFNPSLSFSGTDQLEYKGARFMTTSSGGTMFGAASNKVDGGYENLGDLGIDNPHMGTLTDQHIMWMNGSDPVQIIHPNKLTKDKPHLLGYFWNGGGPNVGSGLRQDGNEYYNGNTEATVVGSWGVVDGMWTIGGYQYVENWQGNIAEIILFDRNLNPTEKDRVESYLSVKYGTTLSHNYLASDGTTIYNVSTYGSNVAGIGRDDAQGLSQKQSSSVNAGSLVTIGLGTAVVTDQSTIAANFSADKSFEMIGDNGQPANYANLYAQSFVSAIPYYSMQRVWRVHETGTVGTITVSIPDTGTPTYLLVRTADATFTSNVGTTEILMASDGNGNLTAQVDFTNGQFFTFAAEINAPGGVANGLDFWFDPAINVTKTGSTVTGWSDLFTGGNNPALTQPTASLRPTYSDGDALSNFNPYINFEDNTRLNQDQGSGTSPYSKDHTIFGVVNQYGTKGSYNNWIRFTDTDNSDAGTHNWGFGYSDVGQYQVSLHYISAPFADVAGVSNIYNRINTRTILNNIPTLYSASVVSSTGATAVGHNGNEATATGLSNIGTFVPYRYLTVGGGNAYGMNNNKTQEIIEYSRTLTIAERQKVQSYLAIRHGITLDKDDNDATIVEGNYVLSDGTVVWDAVANSAYHNDIVVIGRDASSSINHRQSNSVNEGSFLTIGNGTGIAATNAANTNMFSANKIFEAVGSNGLSTSYGTAYAPNSYTPTRGFFHMPRIWKVQETGTVGNVTVSIPGSGDIYLMVKNTNDFSSSAGVTEVKMTPDGNGNMTATFDFTNNQFFTFGSELTAPGCVANGLKFWVKSDVGTSTTTAGSAVSQWNDQSQSGFHLTQPTTTQQPKYVAPSADFNFYPGVDFDDDFLRNTSRILAVTDGITTFSVGATDVLGGVRTLIGLGDNYNDPTLDLDGNWISPWNDGGGSVDLFLPISGVPQLQTNKPMIWTQRGANGVANGYRAGYQGEEVATTMEIVNTNAPYGQNVGIGSDGGGEDWDGKHMEHIVYNRQLTIQEYQKVNSYLAIKYGITLRTVNNDPAIVEGDYISGDGTKVWDYTANTTYHNDVTVVGRDDCQALYHKQSKSVNDGSVVTLGIGTNVVASNPANNNTFTTDKSFEAIGSNSLAASYSDSYTPNSYTPTRGFYRMARIWKVQETGSVGTVTVSIPGSGDDAYLLVKNTNDFSTSSGVTEIKMTPDGNGNLTAQVDFTNGQFFTFGSELTAPGCVAGGLSVWLKADAGTSTTTEGADVDSWQDASGNGRTHVAATGTTTSLGKPSYVVNSGFNFNPSLNFSATGQGDGLVAPAFASGNEAVHVFTVSKVADNGWRAIYSFRRDGTHPQWLTNVPSVWIAGNYSTTTNNGVLYGVTSHILNKTAADQQQIWWNGTKYSFAGNKGYQYSDSWGSNRFYVGNDGYFNGTNYSGSEVFSGDIMEVAIYKTGSTTTLGGVMSDADIKKIQSYFGIKYGITLAHEYYSGGGVKVWDNADATFHRNVAGIGRDDCQALNQKQSRSYTSADMTVAIDDVIATTNAANPGAFSNDKAFLMFGDNNGTGVATLTSNPCNPPIVDKYSNKVWKFVETGSVEAVKLSVDLSTMGFNASYPVFMQVASDASFSTIIASIPMVKNGANYETSYDFNGTRYVRFLGNTTPPANVCTDDKVYRWNTPFWTWGTTSRNTTFADGQNINVRIQGNGIYAPTVYPVSQGWWEHIFIPRYDKLSDNNKIVTRIGMAKVASKVSFEVFDLDEYFGKDVVNVIGKLGATTVSPIITFPKYTALSKTGNTVSATTGVWDISQWGRFYVNFESPIDSVIIEYTRGSSPFSFNFPTYQDIRIENLNITCIPPAPKAPTADNVYIFKEVSTANPKVDEEFTYKFTIQNYAGCDSVRTINFSDILPAGLTWVDSTLATALTLTGLNAYGGTQNLSFSATVPGGTSYLYIKAKGGTNGTYPNQASFTVNRTAGGTSPLYLSDNPRMSGSQDPTPVTINTNKPVANLTFTKSADKSTAGTNENIVYTYSIKNNGGASVTTDFQDNLPANAGGAFTYTGTYTTVPGAPSSIATSPLAGSSSVLIRNITVAAGATVTFTLTANTGTFTSGNTATNIASITPDSNYRQNTLKSNAVNVQIGSCSAGSTAPTLSATTKSNVCSAITANLTTITASNTPSGAGIKLTWHTATPASSGNRVANPASVPAGTYYAVFADTLTNCFAGAGSATTQVTVTTTLCTTTPPNQSASSGGTKTGNAATELNPQGGTGPYNYSNATDICTAPSGATKLPSTSNLTVNSSNGQYSYTAPSTPGTYYYCIKVCDNSSPTPTCQTVTYIVNVGAAATDTDNDGVPDSTDQDDDNDGIPDATEGSSDTDGDGVNDSLDLDADNDGINDVIEAGGTDSNGDGKQDGTPNATTGQIGTGLTPPNSDNDTVPDYKDLDSDNDTVSDLQEGGSNGTDADNDGVVDGPDTDGDGIPNSVDGLVGIGDASSPALPNADGDSSPDYKDVDSDNNGSMDIVQKANQGALDSNNDGRVDNPTDTDGDGIANNSNLDSKPTAFGGLPSAISPPAVDLFPNFTFGGASYTVNATKTIVININEIKGVATSGTIQVFVPTATGFTYSFNGTQTTATVVNSETVNNADWTVVTSPSGMLFKTKAGVSIPANGRSRIAITVLADIAGSEGSVTANITPVAGETNAYNNIAVVGISIQN